LISGVAKIKSLTSWLETGTTDEESVNIGLFGQFLAILFADTATVQNPGGFCSLRREFLGQELAKSSVYFLSLLGSGNFASSDSPGSVSKVKRFE
jgi:hypothetical protein